LNPHIHNPDGDPYPGLAYFIILYDPDRHFFGYNWI
jgi:hypothetical protein